MKQSNLYQIIRLFEKAFIILGLTFFSGVFGQDSLSIVLPKIVVTSIRFFLWGVSTVLVCIFWKKAIHVISQNILFFLLTVLTLVSFIWSDFPDVTLFNSRDILMMTTFGLYFAIRFTLKEQVQLIASTLFLGALLSIIFAIVVPKVGVHTGAVEGHAGVWRGVYGHKNYLGSTMILSCLTFLALPKENSQIYKWIGFALSFCLIIISTSRTSLVLSILLLLIILFYKNFRWQGKISVIFINMGILFLGCLSLVGFTYWVDILTGLGRDPTLTGRTYIWSTAIAKLMERPLLGFGRDAFWVPKSPYAIEAGKVIGSGWVPPHGHNGVLDLTLDVGLIGLAIFLIIYFTAFFRALKQAYSTKIPENVFPLAYLIFLALNNMTESYLLRLENVYWVLFITTIFTINQVRWNQHFAHFNKQSHAEEAVAVEGFPGISKLP